MQKPRRRLTRNASKLQEQKIAGNSKSNPKLFWKYINSKTKIRAAIPDLYTNQKNDPDTMATCDSEKAEVLSEFFSSIYIPVNQNGHGCLTR